MNTRNTILGRIRQSLDAGENDPARIQNVETRLKNHARNTVPARGQLDKPGRVALFSKIMEGQSASVTRLADIADAPAAIADYCRAHNIGTAMNFGDNATLKALDWEGANLEMSQGAANVDTQSSVSTALCAVAETGTLILNSGIENPTTLNFLPDNHMVIVHADDVYACYEDGWDKLRGIKNGAMARNVNFISGPSRTGDIEQTILLGAHGPRRLHVLIID